MIEPSAPGIREGDAALGVTGSRTDGLKEPSPCIGGIAGSSLLNSGKGDRAIGPDDVSFRCTKLKCAGSFMVGLDCVGGVASEPELARGRGAMAMVRGCFGLSSFVGFGFESSFSLGAFGLISTPSLLAFGFESANSLFALALRS